MRRRINAVKGMILSGLLFSAIAIYFILIYVNPIWQAMLFGMFVLVCMHLVANEGVLHPISWFSPFYFAYSVTYPLVNSGFGGAGSVVNDLIPMCFLGYVAFSLVTVVIRVPLVEPAAKSSSVNLSSLALLTLAVVPLIIVGAVLVVTSGATSKREYLELSEGGVYSYIFLLLQIATAGASLRVIERLRRRRRSVLSQLKDPVLLLVFIACVIAMGVTGERDFMFRLLLIVSIILYQACFSYRVRHLVIALLALYLLLPISHHAKAFLLTGGSFFGGKDVGFLEDSDFLSAGRVLEYVLLRDFAWLGGDTLLEAFKRVFSPLIDSGQSAAAWLHNDLRPRYGDSGRSGWGFSIVAEGYINFGKYGVLLVLSVLAAIAGVLYRIHNRSSWHYMYYLLFIGSAIYAIRADLANLLVQTFRHNLVVVLYFSLGCFLLSMSRFNNRTFKL